MIDDTTATPPVGGGKDGEEEGGTPGCVAAMAGAVCAPDQETGEQAEAAGGGWLRGIWSTARNQSANMMGFMRRDLGEFVSVVKSDTKDAVQRTAEVVRDSVNRDTANVASSRLKSGLNRFLDTISTAMVIPPDDSEEETLVYREGGWHPAKIPRDGDAGFESRREGRILGLQMDPKTYEVAPEDEQFPAWCEDFDVDSKKTQISDLLVSNSTVRATYTRLVPSTLLHREFWARYFFRLQSLETEEARWAALKERAGRQESTSQDWGDDWDEETPGAHAPAAAAGEVEKEAQEEEKKEEKEEKEEVQEERKMEVPPVEDTRPESVEERFKVMEKSDVVLVKHKDSPESSSDGSGSAGVPEALPESGDRCEPGPVDARDLEEWEADLDVEVTPEEIEEAKKTARELKDANELDDDEDWENWE